jgi:PAS domain S-box-containing protein
LIDLETPSAALVRDNTTHSLSSSGLAWLGALPYPLWIGQSGRVTHVNQRLLTATGLSQEDILAAGLESAIHPGDLALWQSAWEAALPQREAFTLRLRWRDPNGAWRWYRTNVNPVELDGQSSTWLGTNSDLHGHQLSLEELRDLHHALNVTERLAGRLAAATNLKGAVAMMVEESAWAFGAQSLHISSLERAETLRLLGADEALEGWLVPRASPLNTSLLSKSPVVIEDAPDEHLEPPWTSAQTRSRLHVPLVLNGRVIGLLSLGFATPVEPDSQRLEWLLSIAHLTAQTLERTRLFEETQTLNQTLERRVEERTRELLHRTEELESFVFSASHDLRAPLSVLLTAGRTLSTQANAGDPVGVIRIAQRVERAANRMTQMLSALLNSAKTGESFEDPEAIALEGLIQNVLETLEPRRAARHVSVRVQEGLPTVLLPPTAGFQILLNLIQNAIKFAGRPNQAPAVHIHSSLEPDAPTLLIEDNGAGIPSDAVGRIFEPFFTLGDGDSSGMGLTIVKRLLEQHGGRIEFASVEGMNGTRVKLWLPLTPHSPQS